jgi:hypothetical protein
VLPSTLQLISPTPDGPAAAVAVIWAASVPEGTSAGPLSVTAGKELSMSRVLVTVAVLPAALVAVAMNGSAPSENLVVSTVAATAVAEHCLHLVVSCGEVAVPTPSPATVAEIEHSPDGESPAMLSGQLPRTHWLPDPSVPDASESEGC